MEYSIILNFKIKIQNLTNIEDFPMIPVRLFKNLSLKV